MSKKLNGKFIKALPEKCQKMIKDNSIKFPEHIDFVYGEKIEITLPAETAAINMQTDDGAFEGWVLTIYTMLLKAEVKKEIYLDIKEGFEEKGKKSKGHYNRFLYRLRKFKEQFPFAELSDKLSALVGKYYYPVDEEEYCSFDNSQLVINKPEKEAGCNGKPEIIVEKSFKDNPKMIIEKTLNLSGVSLVDEVYRQLPVGIFKDEVSRNTAVFTGGASAIDLWSISKDKSNLCIYELKVKENTKVGIISELFFYANLMFDVYGPNQGFSKSDKGSNLHRGYNNLAGLEKPIERVYAYFLIEELHPLINAEVVKLLSNNYIKYDIIKYKYELKPQIC